MKRQIKFRVWDKDSKQMDLVSRLEVDDSGHIDTAEGYGGVYHNFELMQYTGLQDVDGKEIYEGDIVRYTRWADHVGIVRYFKPEFELQNIGLNTDIAPTLTMRHELRIIGNIYTLKRFLMS